MRLAEAKLQRRKSRYGRLDASVWLEIEAVGVGRYQYVNVFKCGKSGR